MKIKSKDILRYLKGDSFTTNAKIKLKNTQNFINRVSFLKNIVKNKTVLHFGFLDHDLNIILLKKRKNIWLHDLLCKESKRCFGVDIDCTLINKLKNKGYKNIFCFNILKDKIPKSIKNIEFDYIVLGEILEHIGNPVLFLKKIKKIKHKNIIITVPNAFRLSNFINALFGIERINSDHRFWFTPYTILKILYDSGYKVDELLFYSVKPRINLFKRLIYYLFPMLRDGIIVVACPLVNESES